MSKKFSWLLFDLDNTILDFNASSKVGFRSLMEEIGKGDDWEALYPIYREYNHQIWDQREAGLITPKALKTKRWDLFFAATDIDYDSAEANNHYFQFIKNEPYFVDGALELLDQLKGNYKLMIVTNGLSEVQWNRLEIMKIKDYFDHVIISDEIGSAKPAHEFFDHCNKLIDTSDKSEVLVIGDTLKSDIKGANAFGYKSCWHNYYKQENTSEIKPDYTITALDELMTIV